MRKEEVRKELKPPLEWPKVGVVTARYDDEIQDVWACRYGNLTEIMKAGVSEFGDKEMWYFPDFRIRWTHNQFDTVVNNAACWLRQEYGIKKGDRVAIMMTNLPEAFVSYLALSQIGAISVIINARLAGEEAERQFQDSGCLAAVIEVGLWDTVKHFLGTLPGFRQAFVSGTESKDGAIPLLTLIDRHAPEEILVDVSERDICSLIYTSGTTGVPKGTIITHRNVVNTAMNIRSAREIMEAGLPEEELAEMRRDPNQIIMTPFFHVTTLHTLVNLTLMGTRSVVMSTFDAKKAVDLLIDEKIQATAMVTAMYWLLRMQPRYAELVQGGHLKSISQGGSPMPPEMCAQLSKEFPKAKVGNGYGFTEGASLGWLMWMYGDLKAILAKPGSVGGTLGNSRVRIVDERMNDVPQGKPGQILASSPGISPGYWNLPEETAKSFIKDKDGRRWFLTGDVGYTDEDGYTFVVDRIKSMICRGGENVYTVELENLISQHPKVLEVGVVGVPDNVLGEKIKAVIWTVPGETVTEQEIKEFCKGRIAEYKVPDYVVFTGWPLPKNPGGKIIKSELKTM